MDYSKGKEQKKGLGGKVPGGGGGAKNKAITVRRGDS